MKTTDNFRSDLLLKNVAAALREGYISNDNALYLIGVAAGRIDSAARRPYHTCCLLFNPFPMPRLVASNTLD